MLDFTGGDVAAATGLMSYGQPRRIETNVNVSDYFGLCNFDFFRSTSCASNCFARLRKSSAKSINGIGPDYSRRGHQLISGTTLLFVGSILSPCLRPWHFSISAPQQL